jgi:hypothetical protein
MTETTLSFAWTNTPVALAHRYGCVKASSRIPLRFAASGISCSCQLPIVDRARSIPSVDPFKAVRRQAVLPIVVRNVSASIPDPARPGSIRGPGVAPTIAVASFRSRSSRTNHEHRGRSVEDLATSCPIRSNASVPPFSTSTGSTSKSMRGRFAGKALRPVGFWRVCVLIS